MKLRFLWTELRKFKRTVIIVLERGNIRKGIIEEHLFGF